MTERGYIDRYVSSYSREAKPSCPKIQNYVVDPVGLTESYWAFLFISTAVAMGFALLAMERIVCRNCRNNSHTLL